MGCFHILGIVWALCGVAGRRCLFREFSSSSWCPFVGCEFSLSFSCACSVVSCLCVAGKGIALVQSLRGCCIRLVRLSAALWGWLHCASKVD
eukprot:9038737-Prorocentrum_lima.AAC.1